MLGRCAGICLISGAFGALCMYEMKDWDYMGSAPASISLGSRLLQSTYAPADPAWPCRE